MSLGGVRDTRRLGLELPCQTQCNHSLSMAHRPLLVLQHKLLGHWAPLWEGLRGNLCMISTRVI